MLAFVSSLSFIANLAALEIPLMLAVPPELALAQQNILSRQRPPSARGCNLQPPHHLLHPFRPDVGVDLGGGDALVAEQGLRAYTETNQVKT